MSSRRAGHSWNVLMTALAMFVTNNKHVHKAIAFIPPRIYANSGKIPVLQNHHNRRLFVSSNKQTHEKTVHATAATQISMVNRCATRRISNRVISGNRVSVPSVPVQRSFSTSAKASILDKELGFKDGTPKPKPKPLFSLVPEESDDPEETPLNEPSTPIPPEPPIKKTQLRDDLKQYRLRQCAPSKKPPYTIFSNAVLEGIYAALPTSISELLDIKGIGPAKSELFGDDILEIVSKYTAHKTGGTLGEDSDSALPPPPKPIEFDSLNDEQQRAAKLCIGESNRSVFITGSAGTGKSHVLKYIVQELRNAKQNKVPFGICAPTGVAAINVGGSTLHSFFGIGLGTGSLSSLATKVKKNKEAKKRIDETSLLIIDECSMLSSDLMETLDLLVRNVRQNGDCSDEPFGGMRIIAFGDFFQLPPIYKRQPGEQIDPRWRPFCFDSDVWTDLGLSENVLELTQVMRQKENYQFVQLLNKVRVGRVNPNDITDLNMRCLIGPRHPLPNDGILPTRLYVLNKDVDAENESSLNKLPGKEIVCTATNTWRESMPSGTLASVKKGMKDSLSKEIPEEVRLKIGAQVMLTRNKDLERNLANGSRGVVEKFEGGIPIVRFDCGVTTSVPRVEGVRYNPDSSQKGCLLREQIPLKLAWAVTIHKSQGSTLTRASLDISSAFEYGQCYVALSRVKSLEGLWLERPAHLRHIMVSPQVRDYYQRASNLPNI